MSGDPQYSAQKLRRLMDSGIIGVAFWDGEGRITEANAPWLRTIGYEETAGAEADLPTWLDSTAPEAADLVRKALAQIAARGVCDSFESMHVRADGERIPVLTGGASLEDGGGLTFALDISEQKRLEEKLRQAARLESVGILAGGIAHDFNNLLTGVLANATLALEDATGGSRQAELLRSVVRAAERASDLTQQMLAYAGRAGLQMEYVDVAAVIEEILTLLESVVGKNVALSLEAGEGTAAIKADPAQLQQVVMNLVINAAESIEGAGVVSVRTGMVELSGEAHVDDVAPCSCPAPGRYVFLEVSDTGRGMDEATRQRIFDPFFTTKFTGRGLGLASTLGIVRGHQGALRVRSVTGEGSVFTVFFPASDHAPTYPRANKSHGGPGAGIVLVVDDEEYVRVTVRRTLEAAGYTVVCASGMKDAVQLFCALAPQIDVALVDMTMPEEDGDEVARRLRHFDPNLKVIATSGYPEAEVRGRFGDLMNAFLAKPYRAERLREIVGAVITS
jgi:PAS domain S-box-containing protein